MTVRVQREAFDTGAELAALSDGRTDIGGVCSFTGLVRDLNEGAGVSTLTLEHYPGMTEKMLLRIEQDARDRWPLIDCLIIHRYGAMQPGEPIVLVAAASSHRHAAFDACAYVMDYLKTEAPFWKVEDTEDGQRWVDSRDSDSAAAARWQTEPPKS
ncbi:MAG: molybdopterin synthase catalytic subunit MoaE [Alphaproteobacteria bacterium]